MFGRQTNNLKIGIVGLPNIGKSTLFNVLTRSSVPAENYPFCTIDPSESRVAVPDIRYDWLCNYYQPISKIPAYLTVVDIAGLVKGASEGVGLGNAFLSHIRGTDAIFNVCRGFDDENVSHIDGTIDPIRDIEIICDELRFKDIEIVSKHLETIEKQIRNVQDREKRMEIETIKKVLSILQISGILKSEKWTPKEIDIINKLQLLSIKEWILLVNISEADFIKRKNRWLSKIKMFSDEKFGGCLIIPFCAEYEKTEDLQRSAIPRIILSGYEVLGLIRFFTVGKDEVRAWTIRKGTKAPQAAGIIHSDFERGFIACEITKFEDLSFHGSEAETKLAGKVRLKGADYIIEDGDIVLFRFNVSKKKT